jgi:hypothetical protein
VSALFAVVCVHATGHRTVLGRTASPDRAECERYAVKRDRHPNAKLMGMSHVVSEVREVDRSLAERGYVEVSS